ncbi:MAG: hypothetical protein COX57_08015 [Alphaproteobacteria bacterium CG_4_10_14_0_2_um_filter_63_37]|nr:MAG: hypothetical protein AUJ55_02490 [Proteobacteria bacterium CG1_02_64_396]PJA24564.1 MAG: hypothetical protein COX57_08015 [Alphaproteobacteria bacterium CG_4_10_14_0_2_um_filter_63_37]
MKTIRQAAAALTLGALMIAAPASAEPMKGHGDHDMVMHHMHVMILHASEMAAEGGNLLMLGDMGMAPGVDEQTRHHGAMMLDGAEKVLNEVIDSPTMAAMHKAGMSPEQSKEMAYVHDLAQSVRRTIALIRAMPKVKPMAMEGMSH